MKKKKRKTVYVLVLIFILAFIWGQSCIGRKASSNESRFVTDRIVKPIVRAIAGEQAAELITENTVRKAAHVAEYAVLGFTLGLILKNKAMRFWLCLLLGLAAAFLDETLQSFTGRGSMLTDVWIDLSGVTLGSLISLLF